jgi:hypothetical protein
MLGDISMLAAIFHYLQNLNRKDLYDAQLAALLYCIMYCRYRIRR